MVDVELRLNPALRPDEFAKAFERDGVVQISNLFEPELAQAITELLERQTPWRLVYANDKGVQDSLAVEEASRLGPQHMDALISKIMHRASEGFSYLYLGYDMLDAYLESRIPGHPLDLVTEFLNGEEFRSFGRRVIGGALPTKTEVYASLYRPGDFLNLHDDSYRNQRLAAYTIGFTRQWRPDWGGQLLFHAPDGNITRGLLPAFNTLTLFKTPQAHSVAAVAPYASRPRISLVGWLRGDPPGGH